MIIYIILLYDRVQGLKHLNAQNVPRPTLGVIGSMSISERSTTLSLQTDVDGLSVPSSVGNNLGVQWLSYSVTVKRSTKKIQVSLFTCSKDALILHHNNTATLYQHFLHTGTKTLRFSSLTEFLQWKEHEEERTYTTYIKGDRTYSPKSTNQGQTRLIFTHTYMYHMTFELSVSPPPCTEVKCRYYYVCCRDDNYRGNKKPRITKKKRNHQKSSCKLNATCLSRMYLDELVDKSIKVMYIPAHTGHIPGPEEHKFLPLPQSIREGVSLQLSQGIPAKRILQGSKFSSSL